MTARIIDGRAIADAERERVREEVAALAEHGIVPGLAAVLVGDDPASHVYVGSKERACEAAGIRSFGVRLPADTEQERLDAELDRLNADPAVSGIIVQLPLPDHLDPVAAQERVDPDKDVDGLHPVNGGRLLRGQPLFVPATPLGCVVLLRSAGVTLPGADVVIVGRSHLVGRPLGILLGLRSVNATVTICHSGTKNLGAHTSSADVLVVAAGSPRMITAEMVKPGAAVVDVGINRTAEGRLVGDVDFDDVAGIAGAITPVPGGVGPMTVAMLLHNTVLAARRQAGLD